MSNFGHQNRPVVTSSAKHVILRCSRSEPRRMTHRARWFEALRSCTEHLTMTGARRALGITLLIGLFFQIAFTGGLPPILAAEKAYAAEGIYKPINYQGKVEDSTGVAVADGQYNMRFKIFAAASGGDALWTETWNSSTSRITMTGGLFSVALGTQVAMTGSVDFNSDSLFLQVEFDPGNDDTYEETFSPRRRFASVPYAHNADMLDGLHASQFIRSDQDSTASGTITIKNAGVGLKVTGTASGNIVRADTELRSSGSLIVDGTTTLKNYASCSIITTDSAGNLGCGSADMISQTEGDARYVQVQGATMTGGLLITLGGATTETIDSGLALEIIGTASGRILHAQDLLTSSGGLIVEGTSTFNGAAIFASTIALGGVTYTFPTSDGSASGKVLKTDSAGNLSWSADIDTDTDTTYSAGQGLALNGTVFTLNGTLTGTLLDFDTFSGTTVHAQSLLTVSGSLVIDEAGSIFGAGLADCDGAGNALQWNASTGLFSCTTISGGSDPNVNYYVRTGGDTMTGALAIKVLSGTATGNTLIVDTNGLVYDATNKRVGIGTASPGQKLTVNGDMSIAAASNLYLDGGGDTYWYEDSANRVSLVVGSTNVFRTTASLMEFIDVDTRITTNKNFSLSSDQQEYLTSDGTDISFFVGNAEQVKIDSSGFVGIGTTSPTEKLEVIGTISGVTLHAQDLLTSSGGLVVEGASTLNSTVAINGVLTLDADDIAVYDAAPSFSSDNQIVTKKYVDDNDSDTTYSAGQGLALNGTVFTLNGTLTGSLLDFDTFSGTTVHAQSLLTVSGSLVIDEAGSIFGAGLADCDGAGNALQWDATTGLFSCTTISGGSDPNVDYYVRTGGDTMTGGLLIHSTNDATKTVQAGVLLEVGGVMSGRTLHAQDTLSSSGTLIVDGAATINNYLTVTGGFAAASASGATNTTSVALGIQAEATGARSVAIGDSAKAEGSESIAIGSDMRVTGNGSIGITIGTGGAGVEVTEAGVMAILGGNVGIGSASPETKLEIVGTASGTVLHAQDLLRSSGALIVEGASTFNGAATFASTVRINGVTYAFPTSDASSSGKILASDGAGNLSWTTDQTSAGGGGGGGSVLVQESDSTVVVTGSTLDFLGTDFDISESPSNEANISLSLDGLWNKMQEYFVHDAGGTMTGALILSDASGTAQAALEVLGTASGRILHAQDLLTSSGGLVVEGTGIIHGNLTSMGTISGANLTVMAGADSYVLGEFGIGTSNPAHQLHIYRNDSGITDYGLHIAQAGAGDAVMSFDVGGGTEQWLIGIDNDDNDKFKIINSNNLAGGNDFIISKTGDVGIGDSTPQTRLDVAGGISGVTLKITGASAFDGAATFGSTISLGGVTYTFPTSDGSASGKVLATDSAGNLSWTAQTTDTDTTYSAGQGLALNGTVFTLNGTLTGSSLNFTTISGATLHAQDLLTSSGGLVVEGTGIIHGNLTSMGTISGAALNIMAGANSYIMGNLGVGTNAPQNEMHINAADSGPTYLQVTNISTGVNSTDGALFGIDAGENVVIMTQENEGIGLWTNSTLRMFIDPIGAVGIGDSTPQTKLDVAGGISGVTLKITGASAFDGAATFGSTISLGGVTYTFPTSDGSASGKVLATDSAGNLSWTAQTTDTDTTYSAGQGLALNGTVFTLNGTLTGSLLDFDTFSGTTVHAQSLITSSGALIVEGASTLNGAVAINGVLTLDADDIAVYDAAPSFSSDNQIVTKKYVDDNDSDTTYSAGQGLALNGTVFTLNGTLTGTLLDFDTFSGTTVHAQSLLSVSGSLVIDEAGGIFGAGLSDCDNATTSKLLWDATTGRFSCGTDQSGGGGSSFAEMDSWFVSRSGDTMTGGLLIHSTNDASKTVDAGVLLEVAGVMSGRILHAQDTLSSSGTLIVDGNGRINGTVAIGGAALDANDELVIAGGAGHANIRLVDNDSGEGSSNGAIIELSNATSALTFANYENGDIIFSSANGGGLTRMIVEGVTGDVGIGDSTPQTRLDVAGGISGTALKITGAATFDSTVSLGGVTYTFPTSDGSASGKVLKTNSAGKLSWSDDTDTTNADQNLFQTIAVSGQSNVVADNTTDTLTFVGGSNVTITTNAGGDEITFAATDTNTTYSAGQGLVLTSTVFTLGTSLTGATLMSGSVLHADDLLSVSGSLVIDQNGSFYGAGLADCDNATTSKLLWDATTGQFSCGTDQSGSGGGDPNVDYYVRTGGDTMTGGLLIHSTNDGSKTVQAGVLLEVGGVMSGRTLHAQDLLTSSGRLIVKSSAIAGSGAATIVAAERQTGAYLFASGAEVLALDAYQGTQTGTNAHVAFGYRGYFDLQMYRTGNAGSGGLVVKSQAKRAGTNIFKIISQNGSANNNVFRVTADGQVRADGSVSGGGADYAEWFYSKDTLIQGELVCIDITRNNAVKRCENASDGNLMGVVSSPTQAAFIGNAFWGMDELVPPHYYLIGLLGQVATHVSDENGPVRPGDSLTSASKQGYAMRAKAGDPTVGVALEGSDAKEGYINVLISRRNSSVTVETVEAHVLETVAAMEIEDEVQLLISGAVEKLNVDANIEDAVKSQVTKLDIEGSIAAALASLKQQTGTTLPLEAGKWTAALTFAEGITVEDELKASASVLIEKELIVHGAVTFSGALKVAAGITTDSLIVSGSALILEDLEVAGAIRTESLEATGDIVAGGTLHAAAVEASGATLRGDVSIDGKLILNGKEFDPTTIMATSGGTLDMAAITVREALFVLGDITIEGLAQFLGSVEIRGNLTVSGSLIASGTLVVNDNQAGIAVIPKTGKEVTVAFEPAFTVAPIVTASSDDFTPWRIRSQSATGFTIEIKSSAENKITFTWHALGNDSPKTVTGPEADELAGIIRFPVDELGYPLSSSDIWNDCIRNRAPLDLTGQPFNCRRYHDEDIWTQPDLLVQFLWDSEGDPRLVIPEGYRIYVVTEEEVGSGQDGESSDQDGAGSGTGSTAGGEEQDTGTGSTAGQDGEGSDQQAADSGTGSTAGGEEQGSGTGSSAGGEEQGSGTGSTAEQDGAGSDEQAAGSGTGSTAGGEEQGSGTGSSARGEEQGSGTGSTAGQDGEGSDEQAEGSGTGTTANETKGSLLDAIKGLLE